MRNGENILLGKCIIRPVVICQCIILSLERCLIERTGRSFKWEKMNQTPAPPKTLPRPKNVVADFLDACRAGGKDTAVSFDYGTRLTEFAILGNLAQHAGEGRKLEWDGPNMKIRNLPELNAWVQRSARSGWQI